MADMADVGRIRLVSTRTGVTHDIVDPDDVRGVVKALRATTPYGGRTLFGQACTTVVGGRVVYQAPA